MWQSKICLGLENLHVCVLVCVHVRDWLSHECHLGVQEWTVLQCTTQTTKRTTQLHRTSASQTPPDFNSG